MTVCQIAALSLAVAAVLAIGLAGACGEDGSLPRAAIWAATAAWSIGAVWCIAFREGYWQKVVDLPPNQLAELAAGTVAPLVFFWLLFGYYQQGKELKANSQAIRESLEHQKVLSAATKEQAALLEESNVVIVQGQLATWQPRFIAFEVEGVKGNQLTLRVKNAGSHCFDVQVESVRSTGTRLYAGNPLGVAYWDSGAQESIVVALEKMPPHGHPNFGQQFRFHYQDVLGTKQVQTFRLFLRDNFAELPAGSPVRFRVMNLAFKAPKRAANEAAEEANAVPNDSAPNEGH